MKNKKAVLLFEVTFVVLLVSIISLFLFRGYALFMKVGRKSLEYLKLVLLSEEKIWDWQREEKNKGIIESIEKEGKLNSDFIWQLNLEDTDYDNLKKGILKTTSESMRRKVSLDIVIYLPVKEE